METQKTNKQNNNGKEFKSYYVVWKLGTFPAQQATHDSLNRTMQYGNEVQKKYPDIVEPGLNRTMQYGN